MHLASSRNRNPFMSTLLSWLWYEQVPTEPTNQRIRCHYKGAVDDTRLYHTFTHMWVSYIQFHAPYSRSSLPGIRRSGLSILPLWDQRHRAHHRGSLWPTERGDQMLLPGPAQLPHAGPGWWWRQRGLFSHEWTGQYQKGRELIFDMWFALTFIYREKLNSLVR